MVATAVVVPDDQVLDKLVHKELMYSFGRNGPPLRVNRPFLKEVHDAPQIATPTGAIYE